MTTKTELRPSTSAHVVAFDRRTANADVQPKSYTQAPSIDAVRSGQAELAYGHRDFEGDSVSSMQRRLFELGFYGPGAEASEVDGKFGARTRRALAAYQQSQGAEGGGTLNGDWDRRLAQSWTARAEQRLEAHHDHHHHHHHHQHDHDVRSFVHGQQRQGGDQTKYEFQSVKAGALQNAGRNPNYPSKPMPSHERRPQRGVATEEDFARRAHGIFDRVDSDKNGYMSEGEIDTAMLDKKYTGDDAAAVSALKRQRGAIQEMHNDEWGDENSGITRKDLDALAERGRTGNDSDDDAAKATTLYNRGRIKIADASDQLFTAEGPDARKTRQGAIGDCYMIAAIASKAEQDPSYIRSLVKDNGNGTYRVTLPGERAVDVKAPTDAETAFYSSAGDNGRWLAAIEKGYGQLRSEGRFTLTTNPFRAFRSAPAIPQDAAGGGGFNGAGTSALTGNSTDGDFLALTRESTTREKLRRTLDRQGAITVATSQKPEGLVGGHAYSVLGYDPSTDMVTIRNPWGRGDRTNEQGTALDGNDDGIFQMTVSDMHKHFRQINYEDAAPRRMDRR